jgi:uncharacterized oligopeptide transporter (OPT) family protein
VERNRHLVPHKYFGLGYLIGPKIARQLARAACWPGWRSSRSFPGWCPRRAWSTTSRWRASHSNAEWIYRAYIRYLGAGAVACVAVMTLINTLPTIMRLRS